MAIAPVGAERFSKERIRELRLLAGLSQAKLAEQLGLGKHGHMTVSKWELGIARPNPLSIRELERLERRLIRKGLVHSSEGG